MILLFMKKKARIYRFPRHIDNALSVMKSRVHRWKVLNPNWKKNYLEFVIKWMNELDTYIQYVIQSKGIEYGWVFIGGDHLRGCCSSGRACDCKSKADLGVGLIPGLATGMWSVHELNNFAQIGIINLSLSLICVNTPHIFVDCHIFCRIILFGLYKWKGVWNHKRWSLKWFYNLFQFNSKE